MEDNIVKTGTINTGVVYNDKTSGEEGVVLLVDRKASIGSRGEKLYPSAKMSPISTNISITMAGSAGHGQMSAEASQSFGRDRLYLYEEAAEYFMRQPVISKADLDEIRQRKLTEDIISNDEPEKLNMIRRDLDELQIELNSAILESKNKPGNKEKKNHVDDLSKLYNMTAEDYKLLQQEYQQKYQTDLGERIISQGREIYKKGLDKAHDFFEYEEFQLEIYVKKGGFRYVKRAVPVERRGWDGKKIFILADVALQRVRNTGKGVQKTLDRDVHTVPSEEVYLTVDGMANFLGNLHRSFKEYTYHGIVGGVNPLDGPKMCEVEGWGAGTVIEKTLAATGSGASSALPIMEKEQNKLLKEKGYLTREDALDISLMGGMEAITKDNYCGPPFDVAIIKRNGKMGRIASYKVTIDANRDETIVIMPPSLSVEMMTRMGGKDMYYKATVSGGSIEVYEMPEVGKYGEPAKIDDAELEGDITNVARSCLDVMRKYSNKKQTRLNM